jgi:hypothetical protein
MKIYRRNGFLTLVLDGSELIVSQLGHFSPGERATSTHWIETG